MGAQRHLPSLLPHRTKPPASLPLLRSVPLPLLCWWRRRGRPKYGWLYAVQNLRTPHLSVLWESRSVGILCLGAKVRGFGKRTPPRVPCLWVLCGPKCIAFLKFEWHGHSHTASAAATTSTPVIAAVARAAAAAQKVVEVRQAAGRGLVSSYLHLGLLRCLLRGWDRGPYATGLLHCVPCPHDA